jgi:hypothetical protein
MLKSILHENGGKSDRTVDDSKDFDLKNLNPKRGDKADNSFSGPSIQLDDFNGDEAYSHVNGAEAK